MPRGADSAYLYYLDMSEFKTPLAKVCGEGLLLPGRQSGTGALLQQQAPGRERAAPTSWIFVAASWTLTGYVDPTISAMTQALNGKITLALLGVVAALVLALHGWPLNLAYRPILSLRDLVQELSQGNGIRTRRLAVTSTDDLGQIRRASTASSSGCRR